MPVREIIRASDDVIAGAEKSILRTTFTEVFSINENTIKIVKDLIDTLHSDDLSVGLAAPQIGYPEAIIVLNLNKDHDRDFILINPVILSESGKKDKKFESCMSIPHKRGLVERRKKITVQFKNLDGEISTYDAEGFEARVLSHEIDHVNGILYTDHLSVPDLLEETDLFRKHGII
jgi:peptide deformylase